MILDREENVGVVAIRLYDDKYDCRLEMESGIIGFTLFKSLSAREGELDPELIREYWFRFKFWAHAIDIIRCPWMASVAKSCL